MDVREMLIFTKAIFFSFSQAALFLHNCASSYHVWLPSKSICLILPSSITSTNFKKLQLRFDVLPFLIMIGIMPARINKVRFGSKSI